MARVSFVDGGRDGTSAEMPDPPPPEVRLPIPGRDDRSQVYRVEHDGKYHFQGYSLPVPANDLSVEAQQAIAELVAPLQKLSHACGSTKGFPPLIEIGDWEISPRLFDEHES